MNSLFLDPTFTLKTSYPVTANDTSIFYGFKGGVKWQEMLYEYLIETYFRDEGESLGTPNPNGYIAQIDQGNWAHSLKEESALADDSELPVSMSSRSSTSCLVSPPSMRSGNSCAIRAQRT